MNYTKRRLLRQARYWDGSSLDDLIEKRTSSPMITIEMTVEEWDKIWEEDGNSIFHLLKSLAEGKGS